MGETEVPRPDVEVLSHTVPESSSSPGSTRSERQSREGVRWAPPIDDGITPFRSPMSFSHASHEEKNTRSEEEFKSEPRLNLTMAEMMKIMNSSTLQMVKALRETPRAQIKTKLVHFKAGTHNLSDFLRDYEDHVSHASDIDKIRKLSMFIDGPSHFKDAVRNAAGQVQDSVTFEEFTFVVYDLLIAHVSTRRPHMTQFLAISSTTRSTRGLFSHPNRC